MNARVPPEMLIGDNFAEYMHASETQAKVIPAQNYRESLKAALFTKTAQAVAALPWGKTLDQVQLRPGEVSMWAGANGSGKSMLLSHVVLGLLRQGEKACIASFEMKPVRQLERMARQTSQCARPAERAVDNMLDWLVGKLWFYDQQGTVKPAMVYAVCRYAADKLKCRHVVIDSLMKCVRGEDDYNAQKDFVDEITAIARDLNIHVHLV
ncbi:MAG: AAA family ATPase, partial [Sulfuricaulis sp.]|nr:AAA family ATPase [Sulfuricaulis sp.]